MNQRGFTCIELLVATAFLAVAASAIAKQVQAEKDWKRSGELASKAIAQAKAHHVKEVK